MTATATCNHLALAIDPQTREPWCQDCLLGGPDLEAAIAQTHPLLAWRLRYADHSELFVREVLIPADWKSDGKDLYPWQQEALAAYDRREPRIAIRSGHGVGKSTWLAWVAWHRILFRFPQKTAVTAPSEKQLFDAFWAEFETWGTRLPKGLSKLVEVKADSAELVSARSESFISIKTARAEQPGALQGLHSDWELLLVDEASDVPDAVWQAGGSSLTGPHPMAILTGNPLSREGFFYRAHTELASHWWTLHVPRSAIGVDLDTDSYAKEQEAESGGRHTNQYRIRVLGEFPISEDDVIIPFDLVEPALTRDVQTHKSEPVVWGLDCARFGSNRSALAKRRTRELLEPIRWWAKLDTMELAARVKVEWDTTPEWMRPVCICVDEIGIGGGVVDRLKALGLPTRGINVQEVPAVMNVDRYKDLRTELWFKGKDWFAQRNCKIPVTYSRQTADNPFIKELTSERYDFQGGKGRIRALPKDAVHSPDLADAFMLTFAVDAISLAHGRQGAQKPFQPRIIQGLP